MLDLIIWAGIFIAALAVLIKSSDFFINSAEKLGLYLGLPSFIVGVSVVAIGTSLPELASSIFAVARGSSEIVVANVVGSNIANIFLILGITAIAAGKIKTKYNLIKFDLPMLVGSAFLLAVTIWDGRFTLMEAVILLSAFTIYLYYTLSAQLNNGKKKEGKFPVLSALVLVVSAAFIYMGSKYTIESLLQMSSLLGVGVEVITVTALALGTSLPELTVSIGAVRKGKMDLALGNILGSNIFNTLAVMGVPAILGTLFIPQSIIWFGLPMMIIATLLFFIMAQDKEINEWEGWFLVLFYVFFVIRAVS